MKVFKTLLITALFGCMLSCSHKDNKEQTDVVFGTTMQTTVTISNATPTQVDSVIKADNLPMITDWAKSTFTDYETGEVVKKEMYIKQDEHSQVVYVVTGNNAPYIITKRITK